MNARAVCGCTPPNLAPVPREPYTIAEGLADAAEYLHALAERINALGDDTGELEPAELDALACGISRAACELRMRQHGKDGVLCQD
jgi:hypothetical protein